MTVGLGSSIVATRSHPIENRNKIETELAPFLESYHLIIPRQIDVCDDQYAVEGDHLIGSHILHPSFKITLTDPRSAGIKKTTPAQVYLANSNLKQFWNISKYIRSTVCPECRHPRILIAGGRKQFIDVLMGHRVELVESTP